MKTKKTLARTFAELESCYDSICARPGAAAELLAGIEGGFERLKALAAALVAATGCTPVPARTSSTAAFAGQSGPTASRVAGAAAAEARDELAPALVPPGDHADFKSLQQHYLALIAHGRSLEAGQFHAKHAKRFYNRA